MEPAPTPPRANVPRQAILIVNALSRQGQKQFDIACEKLAAAGIDLIETIAVDRPGTLPDIVAGAIAKNPPMLIVGGGDGSLSCAVDHLVGSDIVFAILPLGTANSFARTLEIPLDLDGAVDVIANGDPRRIDLGMIDGDYYCNCAAIGLSTRIGDHIPSILKKTLGRVGYLIWAAYQSLRFRPFRATITVNGKAQTMRALEIRIANGRYHGGTEVVEEADLESGEIVVQLVPGTSAVQLGWSWLATSLKLRARKDTTVEFHGREIRIETHPPQKISIDGEVLAKTPVTAKVARAAALVMAPGG